MIRLMDAQGADGAGQGLTVRPRAGSGVTPPVTGHLYVWGPFDGATAYLEISPDGTEWFRLPDLTFAAKDAAAIDVRARALRGYLEGAGAASAVEMVLFTPDFWSA